MGRDIRLRQEPADLVLLHRDHARLHAGGICEHDDPVWGLQLRPLNLVTLNSQLSKSLFPVKPQILLKTF